MAKDYKIVLVLGNGFDIDLNLKTGYPEFIKSSFFQKYLDKTLIGKQIDYIYSHEVNLFNYLHDKYQLQRWIDVEIELAKWASRESPGTFHVKAEASELEDKTFMEIHDALCEYLESIDYSKINKDSRALSLLKIVSPYKSAEILSFNYTDLTRLKNHVSNIRSGVDHIHGRLNNKSIILGFHDDIEIDESYNFMIKSFSPYYKSHNVSTKLQNADEIIFFGHSLGSTDYHYFQDLFIRQCQVNTANKKLILRIFTYDEQARRSILKQLREMNEKHTNRLYEFCDFEIYRTGVADDNEKINFYLTELEKRLKKVYAPPYIIP